MVNPVKMLVGQLSQVSGPGIFSAPKRFLTGFSNCLIAPLYTNLRSVFLLMYFF